MLKTAKDLFFDAKPVHVHLALPTRRQDHLLRQIYYMLLRVVVLAAAFLLAGLAYQQAKQFTIWIGMFLITALVFNPFVPIHLTRGVWSILNIAAAVLFVGHFAIARSQSTKD